MIIDLIIFNILKLLTYFDAIHYFMNFFYTNILALQHFPFSLLHPNPPIYHLPLSLKLTASFFTNFYCMWCIYMCVYIHIYKYNLLNPHSITWMYVWDVLKEIIIYNTWDISRLLCLLFLFAASLVTLS